MTIMSLKVFALVSLLVFSLFKSDLQDADVLKPGKTIWYLEHVPAKMQCFTHTVRRYIIISNLH